MPLAFLKDAPLSDARLPWLLYLSWWLFTGAIVMTVASLLVSQEGIQRQLKIARRYHKDRIDAAADEKNRFAAATVWLNTLSGVAFIAAVLATTWFISANVEKASTMAQHQKPRTWYFGPMTNPTTHLMRRGTPREAMLCPPCKVLRTTQRHSTRRPANPSTLYDDN